MTIRKVYVSADERATDETLSYEQLVGGLGNLGLRIVSEGPRLTEQRTWDEAERWQRVKMLMRDAADLIIVELSSITNGRQDLVDAANSRKPTAVIYPQPRGPEDTVQGITLGMQVVKSMYGDVPTVAFMQYSDAAGLERELEAHYALSAASNQS